MAELVNFVLRVSSDFSIMLADSTRTDWLFFLQCCGCNASIDEHQAEDENGIVENLKDIVDEFKQVSVLIKKYTSLSPAYSIVL